MLQKKNWLGNKCTHMHREQSIHKHTTDPLIEVYTSHVSTCITFYTHSNTSINNEASANLCPNGFHITVCWFTHSKADLFSTKSSNLQPSHCQIKAVARQQAMHVGTRMMFCMGCIYPWYNALNANVRMVTCSEWQCWHADVWQVWCSAPQFNFWAF